MDGIIDELNKTKRLFIIMILTVMIIPPMVFVITFELLGPPGPPSSTPSLNSTSTSSSSKMEMMAHHKSEHREGLLGYNPLFIFKEYPFDNWYCLVGYWNKTMDFAFKVEQKISKI